MSTDNKDTRGGGEPRRFDRSLQFASYQVDFWDGPWQNRQAFLSELATRHPVLFVSPPFEIGHVINGRASRMTKLAGLSEVSPNVHSYVPSRAMPVVHRVPALGRLSAAARGAALRSAHSRAGFTSPVQLIWHPNAAIHWPQSLRRPVVYYKYDHYPGYGGVPAEKKKFLNDTEQRLVAEADLVFVTSMGLEDLHREDAPGRLHLLPNGVDFATFRRAALSGAAPPADLAAIPRPRIGYVGVINEKVDFALVRQVAAQRPGYSFVMVGPAKCRSEAGNAEMEALKALPNVHFLGPKRHDEVPAYNAGLDVGMMCYVLTAWVRFGYPLKLHEYLAAGLPSVGTALPELVPFQHVVSIATGADEWAAAIDAQLATKEDPQMTAVRVKVAEENSWSARADRFVELVRGLVQRQGRR